MLPLVRDGYLHINVFFSFRLQVSPTETVGRLVEVGTSRGNCNCNRVNGENGDLSEASAPLISRSPSSVCPPSPIHQEVMIDNSDRLDDVDGLPLIHCDIQLRVQQIIVEHKVPQVCYE